MIEEKNTPTLLTPIDELETQLLEENNVENIKNIIDLFNVNIQKKNIIRTNKLNELQDKVYEQIDKRISVNADTFSNKDLLEYFKTIQETINKTDLNSAQVNIPQIQLNQNNLNLNISTELNRDSRQRITDAIKNILNSNTFEDIIEDENSKGENNS